jgi:hypothetical protein
MKAKPFDFAAIFLSLCLTIFSFVAVYAKPQKNTVVNIKGAGQTWVFPLEAEEMLPVHGPLGDTVVEISAGSVRVVSSPCANQTCVAAGHIHGQGRWVACLPNGVVVSIEGGDDGGLDAAAW